MAGPRKFQSGVVNEFSVQKVTEVITLKPNLNVIPYSWRAFSDIFASQRCIVRILSIEDSQLAGFAGFELIFECSPG